MAQSSDASNVPVLPPIRSDRPDGRYRSTAGLVHHRLDTLRPRLSFDPAFSPRQFAAWKLKVRRTLKRVLGLKPVPPQPPPKLISDDARSGYRVQRWELFPEPFSVVPMTMLVPDCAARSAPAPAVICCPGSDHSTELLIGELPAGTPTPPFAAENAMALHYVRQGLIALCIENPGTAGMADPRATDWRRQCSELMWLGTSYEALSVSHKIAAYRWLRKLPIVDAGRIATCGHSLGAKPALLLGVLEPGVAAVVWNSGAYDWRHRHVATNLFPVAPWQYIPGFIEWFDYLDLKAALAPTPLMASESARSDEIKKVRQAYALAGAAENFRLEYMPSFRSAKARTLDRKKMPQGLSPEVYLRYLNGTNGEHYFKDDVVVPWMTKVLLGRNPIKA